MHTGTEPKEWIEVMKYSPDGKFLAIGSHDDHIYIYDAETYRMIDKGWKHSSYIVGLDWSLDSKVLKSHSGAYELLFWTFENGRLTQNPGGATAYKNEVWNTYSTHFGWHVQGIFGGVIDYTHVNRIDRDPSKAVFAVANDWGLVELFGNPNSEEA